MAATTLFTCVCGVQKKTTNHWVLATVSNRGISFMAWDDDLAMRRDIIVLCGEGCAAGLLSRSLSEWKQPGPKATVSCAAVVEAEQMLVA